jgi:hypothetical protein
MEIPRPLLAIPGKDLPFWAGRFALRFLDSFESSASDPWNQPFMKYLLQTVAQEDLEKAHVHDFWDRNDDETKRYIPSPRPGRAKRILMDVRALLSPQRRVEDHFDDDWMYAVSDDSEKADAESRIASAMSYLLKDEFTFEMSPRPDDWFTDGLYDSPRNLGPTRQPSTAERKAVSAELKELYRLEVVEYFKNNK